FMAFMAQTLTQVTDEFAPSDFALPPSVPPIPSGDFYLGDLLGRAYENSKLTYEFASDADFARCRAAVLDAQGQPKWSTGDPQFVVTAPSGQTTFTKTVGENGTAPLLTWDSGTSNGRSRKSGYFDVRAYPQLAPSGAQPVSYDHREMIGLRLNGRGMTTT